MSKTELERIDWLIQINWWLIADGPHPAVDHVSVRAGIDRLLDQRLAIMRGDGEQVCTR